MYNIKIGYDSRESVCYDVCKKSILNNSNDKLTHIAPIIACDIKEYNRAVDPLASTEFTYTRFLVPWLQDYNGWALFCDCDFVFLNDVSELFDVTDEKYAVMVCKHDYNPHNETKMDGRQQTQYPRKNWSSLILWNCSHPANKILTPDVINTQSGKYLHRFEWLMDSEIGSIPVTWNWLVGWYREPQDGTPKALHYTEGGPWFDQYKDCEYADVWYKYHEMCSSR